MTHTPFGLWSPNKYLFHCLFFFFFSLSSIQHRFLLLPFDYPKKKKMVASKKHTSAKHKPSNLSGKVSNGVQEYGEGLVGSKIRVWWPIDREFYMGVVDSFESSKKKHRVIYDDGDEEDLDMKKERWELIEEDADEISLQDESANGSSDATPKPLSRKDAKSNGKSSEKGKTNVAMPKKKQKTDSSAKSKSKAKSGKKSEDGEGESEKPKGGVKKAEKSKDDAKQTLKTRSKPETERNGKMGDVGGKIVAAASRMTGRFQSKENGQERETPKSLQYSKKISELNNPKQKRRSSSSEVVYEKVKKPKTSSKKIKSNITDDEDGVDDEDTSDDESIPLASFLKKSSKAMEEALMERKKEKEAGEGSSGNEAEL